MTPDRDDDLLTMDELIDALGLSRANLARFGLPHRAARELRFRRSMIQSAIDAAEGRDDPAD